MSLRTLQPTFVNCDSFVPWLQNWPFLCAEGIVQPWLYNLNMHKHNNCHSHFSNKNTDVNKEEFVQSRQETT